MKYTKFGDKIRIVVQIIRRKSKSLKELADEYQKNICEMYVDEDIGTKGD